MTNAEKFEKVFGCEHDREHCPCFAECKDSENGYMWWSLEYRRNKNETDN